MYNHRFFFEGLTNPASVRPSGTLAGQISRDFRNFRQFLSAFEEAALSVFGFGYAWLVYNGRNFEIITTANQDCPLSEGLCPILNIDVWEHAYYLKHYNMRADYIDDWAHIINWGAAERNYLACLRSFGQRR